MNKNLFLRGGTIISASGLKKADVLIESGIIRTIKSQIPSIKSQTEIIDASGLLLFPGLIDCHVHFREPGLTHKATMLSESRAAIAGGVTTVCEMPNTIPPTVTVAAFKDKVERASTITDCDLRFFFGITEPAHLEELKTLWTQKDLAELRSRCCGIKLYLDHSTGNQKVREDVLSDVFRTCAELGIVIVAHCEDPAMNAEVAASITSADVSSHSLRRPAESEDASVAMAIGLARKTGAHLHVAHLSSKGALSHVRAAKKEGLKVTCDVTPHHLFLSVDDYDKLGTLIKVNPPIRTKDHCEALWKGVMDGTVDCIASDHAPHTLEEKQAKNPLEAPSGVPGVETMVPLLLSTASGQRLAISDQFRYEDIVRLCFENPNRIFNLGKKGIVEGAKADIVLVNPKEEWTIRAGIPAGDGGLHSKCGWTAFEGWGVRGRIRKVL